MVDLRPPVRSFCAVSQPLPSVSIIIAARPGQAEVKSAVAAKQLDYPADRLEIIIARGKQPSVQRNVAARAAKGDLIYFLDDDSVANPGNLRLAIRHFADPTVMMVGGPNLCPADAPPLEQIFAVVLSSWIAFGPSRARYAKAGVARASGEKELILCNLLVRREAFLELGGFDEALYPNEENALMDELLNRGGKLIYDPELVVFRRPRPTLKAFSKMLRTYGRGRAEQFRLHPTLGSALNFVPPLFVVYLFALLVLLLIPGNADWNRVKLFVASPLALYAFAILGQTLASVPAHGLIRSLMALPLLVESHVYYGLGFWHGLFTTLHTGKNEPRPKVEVVLENVGALS